MNLRSWSRNVLGWFIAFPSEPSTRALGNRTPDFPINGPMGVLLRDWGTPVERLGSADKQSYVIDFVRNEHNDHRIAGCALVSLLLVSRTRLYLCRDSGVPHRHRAFELVPPTPTLAFAIQHR